MSKRTARQTRKTRDKVSVIIITLNEECNLPRILGDLDRQTTRDFEVIVADSNSEDATVAVARSFMDRLPLRVVEMSGKGVSLGRNTGASQAKYERLLFLDADTRFDADFLDNSLNQLEARGLHIGGVYLKCGESFSLLSAGMRLFNLGQWLFQRVFPMATGACLFSTRMAHEKLGGFDEAIVLCEDCDYIRRAVKEKGLRFGMVRQKYFFNTRRLEKDGVLRMGFIYLRANFHRLFFGELYGNPFSYRFDHYDDR